MKNNIEGKESLLHCNYFFFFFAKDYLHFHNYSGVFVQRILHFKWKIIPP